MDLVEAERHERRSRFDKLRVADEVNRISSLAEPIEELLLLCRRKSAVQEEWCILRAERSGAGECGDQAEDNGEAKHLAGAAGVGAPDE